MDVCVNLRHRGRPHLLRFVREGEEGNFWFSDLPDCKTPKEVVDGLGATVDRSGLFVFTPKALGVFILQLVHGDPGPLLEIAKLYERSAAICPFQEEP